MTIKDKIKHFSLFNKIILVYAVFVIIYGCTVLINTGGSKASVNTEHGIEQDVDSNIGSQIKDIEENVDKINNPVEGVKETVKAVDSTLVKTIKEQ
jgi:hypothetical protein